METVARLRYREETFFPDIDALLAKAAGDGDDELLRSGDGGVAVLPRHRAPVARTDASGGTPPTLSDAEQVVQQKQTPERCLTNAGR